MKIKTAIVSFMLMLAALPALAQTGGVKGVVMDREASRRSYIPERTAGLSSRV